MKIRNGFVSNSSSSSFVIGYSGEITDEELRERLTNAFGFPDKSFLKSLEESFVNLLMCADAEDFDQWIEDCTWGNKTKKDALEQFDLLELYQQNWNFRQGSVSWNEGDPEEGLLANYGLDYQDDNVFIKIYT